MAGTETPCAVWDLTIPGDRYTSTALIQIFTKSLKHWAFQLERGEETGFLHYQCRVSISPKKRQSAMIKWVNATVPGAHLSRTSTNSKGDDFYVLKDDTRVEGPWTSQCKYDTPYLQKRFQGTITWLPWQQQLLNMVMREPNDRTVECILDTQGCQGKTFVTAFLAQTQGARRVPQQKDCRDILRYVCDMPKANVYFFDLPRAISGRDQHSIFSGIEEIKNGYCYDDRYSFKEAWFEPPHVWVFTNKIPDLDSLSADRWRFWSISTAGLGVIPTSQLRTQMRPLPAPGASL